MKSIQIYTDGSCIGNPGPGGWAALLVYGKHQCIISGNERDTTNNRMELSAVLMALRNLKEPCSVLVVTDSQYVRTVVCHGGDRPAKTFGKKVKKNMDLIKAIRATAQQHDVLFHWVRGHNGHIENELVDKEARKQANLAR